MKKIYHKLIASIFFIIIFILVDRTSVNAASASISANKTTVEVGENVNINVSIDAVAWNIKVNGSGISDSIMGYDMDSNKITNKSYQLDTSKAGTYKVSLSGDATDEKGIIYPEDSVTIVVSEKKNNVETKTSESKQENNNTKQEVEKTAEQEKPAEQEKTVETEKKEETTSKKNETVPEVTVSESNKTMYAKEEVNVRSSYSTSSKAIGSLRQDEQITVTGITSNGWTRIKYNGQTAYVSSQFLTDTKPREKSSNNYLKSLKIEEASLTPEFSKETTSYKANIGKDIEKLKINASAEDDKSKVEISGNEELKEGENTVKIIVTAENGETKTYTITVTKEKKGKLQLSSLQIAGITLNETFKSDKYEYSANLQDNSDITKLEVKATANDKDATIEILGNDKLVIGENVITIMLKSKDGKENVTYQIIVNKKAYSDNVTNSNISNNNPNNDMFLYVAVGIFSIALILIIIIIVRSIKKSKEDEFDDEDLFRTDNNYTEELYSVRTENVNEKPIEQNNEKLYKNEDNNKLYDVEKEVDFSDDEEKPKKRKGGKHSK